MALVSGRMLDRKQVPEQVKKLRTPAPIVLSPALEDKCNRDDQFRRFDSLVGRLMAISPARTDEIRGLASVRSDKRGRPTKPIASPDIDD